MADILELNNITFTTQNVTIIKNFSCQFEEGKTTALVGPSGCGKSTVLKLCAGLLIPSSGEVSFRGKDVLMMNRQENLAFRREGAMVFQDSALWANQNLLQNLELPLRIHYPQMTQGERESRIQSILQEVGYKRDLSIRPSQLSMGEQKLIAFARAELCWPKLMFLDEWTESLDESAAIRLNNLVRRHQTQNHTIICVSHDFRIVKNMADFIIMVLAGKFFLKFTRQQIEEDQDLAQYVENGIAS
ncbi:MAG: ATP-binding cassette domain-containing protein [Treponema sp.]|nr:ATP-binding cassette domain-containing protein [Treponema sp.]